MKHKQTQRLTTESEKTTKLTSWQARVHRETTTGAKYYGDNSTCEIIMEIIQT